MLGEVTRHMLPHLPGVPHLHVNRPSEPVKRSALVNGTMNSFIPFADPEMNNPILKYFSY